MAAASVPADSHQSETMWQCMTVGCRLIHPGAGHRHCCSLCPVTQGARHKRRCRILQQNLARGSAAFPAVSVCTTDGCDRLAGPGFDTCCSLCRRHRRHSHRCESLQQRVPGTLSPPLSLLYIYIKYIYTLHHHHHHYCFCCCCSCCCFRTTTTTTTTTSTTTAAAAVAVAAASAAVVLYRYFHYIYIYTLYIYIYELYE